MSVLVQTDEGTPTTIKNKWNESRTVTIDRCWAVRTETGEVIGRISYRMLTRERRGKGMRYVYARWQSPGWVYTTIDGSGSHFRGLEASSRKDAIQRIEREHAYLLRTEGEQKDQS